MLLQRLRLISPVQMILTASLIGAYYRHIRKEAGKGRMPGTTDQENQIDWQIHRLKIYFVFCISFQSGVPEGLLLYVVSENIRSPIYSVLKSRQMLH